MNYLKTFLPYLFGNKQGKSYILPLDIDWEKLKFEEVLMFHVLHGTGAKFADALDIPTLAPFQVFHLFSFKNHLSEIFFTKLKDHYKNEYEIFTKAKSHHGLLPKEVQEIFNHKNHELSVFAILQKDRSKAGSLFIRQKDGSFLHTDKGSVWRIPVLGLSRRELPFNHSNGATPAGVYRLDSVMPETNKQGEFGKFRRLIVNFLAKTPGEENTKQFLPKTQHQSSWWLPAIVARELGRSLLRIHGTGEINKKPFSPHFPMTPSSGCLTTRETHFMGLIKLNHQRLLLDALMKAQGLPPTYENESKIHGVLYVIEFDGTYQALEFKR